MTDYSDIFFLIGAMVIFSILARNASHMIQHTDSAYTQSDIEYEAIALGQDVIDKAKWAGEPSKLLELEQEYDNRTVTVTFGSDDQYQIDYLLNMEVRDTTVKDSKVINKKVTLDITNELLLENRPIRMEFIKSYVN